MSVSEQATTIDALAERVGRLSPPRGNDPERFHIEKSELRKELRDVAYWLRTGIKP